VTDKMRVKTVLGLAAKRVASSAGYRLVPKVPKDLGNDTREIIGSVQPFTMTSPERIAALCSSIDYVVDNDIPGSIVECGVWRGGSMMAAALRLIRKGDKERDLYLYDTFSGLTTPSEHDRRAGDGRLAEAILAERDPSQSGNIWCVAGLADVQANLARTNYPAEKCHYVEGPVEETIPSRGPLGPIAILRLDTDWYQSTLHELNHLYTQIVPGGVLIIDDYGFWEGARKAVDEFLGTIKPKPLLARIDDTGRLAVKPVPSAGHDVSSPASCVSAAGEE
jgi:O-methyltransferase